MRRWPSPHPGFEYVPDGRSSVAGEARRRCGRGWNRDAFEEQRIEPLDFKVGGKKVLVRQHAQARGAGSGINLDQELWAVLFYVRR